MDLLEDLIEYIIHLSCATKKDVDIFKDFAPKLPHRCLCVYEYAGSKPSQWAPISVRSFQIVSRDKTKKVAREKAWELYQKLLPLHDDIITLGGVDGIISLRDTPYLIDIDNENRALVSFNLAITIKL